MDLYAFADAPISAGFRNLLRLAMILSGKTGKRGSANEHK